MNKKSKILLTAAIVALLGFSAYYFKDSALFKGILRPAEPPTAEKIANDAMAPLASVVVPIKAGDADCPDPALCTWPLTPGKESAFKIIAEANFSALETAGEWRSIEAGYDDDLDITYNTDGTTINNVAFVDRSIMSDGTTPAAYTINWGDGSDLVEEDMTVLGETNRFDHDFDTVEKTTVVYTVIDADGRSDSVTFEVTPPPVVAADPADPAPTLTGCTATAVAVTGADETWITWMLTHTITDEDLGNYRTAFSIDTDDPFLVWSSLENNANNYTFSLRPPLAAGSHRLNASVFRIGADGEPTSAPALRTSCNFTVEPDTAASNVVLAAKSVLRPTDFGDFSYRIDPADLRRMAVPTPETLLPLQMSAISGATVYFKAAGTADAMMVAITPRDKEIRPALLRIGAEAAPAPVRPADDGSLPRRPVDDGSLPSRPDPTTINAVCNANPLTAAVGETITFTGAGSTGAYTSAALNFGDEDPTIRLGATEVSRVTGNTTHIYATAGTYDFSIGLWGADGTGDICEKTVTITAPVTITQKECADGLDNDGDRYIDLVDSGCTNAIDDDERTQITTQKECADGRDNDGDGEVDLLDEGCDNAADDDEVDAKEPTVKPKTSTDDEISFDSCIKKNKKAKQFADVDDDDHGADVIAILSRAKYIGEYDPALDDYILKGYEEDGERQFKPERTVSRAEWTKMIELGLCAIDKAIDDGDFDEDPVGYADTKDHWAAPYVNIAGNLGIVDKNKPKFNPNNSITKAEAVKMILEIDGTSLRECDEDDYPFDDVDTDDDWFVDYACSAYEWGMVEGRKTSSGKLYFDGNRYLSRLGAAILLYNYLVVADDIEDEDAPEPIKIKRITN